MKQSNPTSSSAVVERPSASDLWVESWRVVVEAVGGVSPTADATVRLTAGDHRLLATGEGSSVERALGAAIEACMEELPSLDVAARAEALDSARRECGLAPVSEPSTGHACIVVFAMHERGLLGRTTALVNCFAVSRFRYELEPDCRHARIAVCLDGTPSQVERVASKLRRIVGVLAVETDRASEHA